MRILVTGGCGFIGSNFIRYILKHYKPAYVTNVDVLTYAGNLANLDGLAEAHGDRYEFFKADIANADQMDELMTEHQFYAIINFAAESHVDRSINSPQNFIHTNVSRHQCAAGLRRAAMGCSVSFKSQPTKFTVRLGADGKIYRTIAARSQLALFREQSRSRSPRARFLQDLRARK